MTELDLAVALVLDHLPESIHERTRVLTEVVALIGEKHPLHSDVMKQVNSLRFAGEQAPITAAKFRNIQP